MRKQGDVFPGLVGLVCMYMDTLDVDVETRAKLEKYVDLIRRRANGKVTGIRLNIDMADVIRAGSLQTPAAWIRNFVRKHPAYKYDSVVGQEINYDLMVAVDEM
jgi:glutamate--cysteine ligase catalytic subunit